MAFWFPCRDGDSNLIYRGKNWQEGTTSDRTYHIFESMPSLVWRYEWWSRAFVFYLQCRARYVGVCEGSHHVAPSKRCLRESCCFHVTAGRTPRMLSRGRLCLVEVAEPDIYGPSSFLSISSSYLPYSDEFAKAVRIAQSWIRWMEEATGRGGGMDPVMALST